jgi:hypothetical protein
MSISITYVSEMIVCHAIYQSVLNEIRKSIIENFRNHLSYLIYLVFKGGKDEDLLHFISITDKINI